MLTIIELPLQILEMTQSSKFMEHWTFREHEIQKGGPTRWLRARRPRGPNVKKIMGFDPNWAFPDSNYSLISLTAIWNDAQSLK